MADPREDGHEHAHGVVRARGAARCGSDDDPRSVSVERRRVTLYHAADCSLCARALEVVQEVAGAVDVELELVDIGGIPELEARYRELIPAVEIDGELAFTYFVDPEALHQRLRAVPPARTNRP